ncbi:MAG: HigA family addiction module antitoxin [Leptolinea sp.]
MSNPIQNQYVPDFVSPPGETLFEIIEERGMSQAELAKRTGRPKKTINEIIKGKTAITPETALQLERVLGTPASFWNNRERNYREWFSRQEERKTLTEHVPWMKKFPVRAMIKLRWIMDYDDPIDQIEELLRFFGVASPIQWQDIWQGAQVAYRQSPTFAADPAAVSAWLRKGELEAQKIQCAPYDENRFHEALQQIRNLTSESSKVFLPQLTELCSQAGVAVVFVPEIPGTRTCGATRWLTPTKAMVMLSLRYKTDDQLWFTFFHESAHILLHGKRDVFVEGDNEVSEKYQGEEAAADKFSANFLIPPEELQNFHPRGTHYSHEDINMFAQRLGIAPGIIIGRLQHDKKISPQYFNQLKRRFQWVNE